MRRVLLMLALLAAAAASAQETGVGVPRPALPAAKAVESRLLSLARAGQTLTAVGQQGLILHSADGQHWRQLPSPTSSMLNRVRFADEKHGWIVGYDASVLASRDGGQSWQLMHFDAEGRALFDVLFLDTQRGLAVGGYGTVLTTEDGGASWRPQESVLSELALHLNAIVRLRDGSVLAVGEKGLLAQSRDEGQSWQLKKSPYVGSWFGALPVGEKGALLFGMRGNVFSTADVSALAPEVAASFDQIDRQSLGDATEISRAGWRLFKSDIRESLFGGTLQTPQTAVLVGVNGVISRADLTRGTLSQLKRLKDEPLADVVSLGSQLIVVGRRGVQNLGANP